MVPQMASICSLLDFKGIQIKQCENAGINNELE